MATASGSSSSGGSRVGKEKQTALCPFCRTATVVERTSRTQNNPDKQYYTCKNRDWGKSSCSFFMWKPSSNGVDEERVMAGLQDLEKSVLDLCNVVSARDISSIAREQRVLRSLLVGSICLGVVSFVVMCMLMYNQSMDYGL